MVTRETDVAGNLASVGLPNDAEIVAKLTALAELLRSDGIRAGFIGPNEADRIWDRHIFECAALLPFTATEEGSDVADVGSGAGLPGLVLACFGLRVTLIDALAKRCRFIERVAEQLALPASAIHGRAEDVARETTRRDAFGTVTARALAPPPVALELCAPLVQPGGRILLMAEDLAGVAEAVAQLACGPPERVQLAVPGGGLDRWVIIVGKIGPTPDRFPRRAGLPERKPLG
jgi:16S rRNA (guanine527-N7)-methyltransferase